jgi:hypothetical protein
MSKGSRIKAIQAEADATDNNDFRIAFGEPGNNLENRIGEVRPTGRAWEPALRAFDIIMQGLARHAAVAREMGASGSLTEYDRRIELTENGVTVTVPAAEAKFIGEYIIKTKGVTGGEVEGIIDGEPMLFELTGWEYLRLYCNGVEWLRDGGVEGGPPPS